MLHIKNLIPSLRNFDGSEPIALLKFLRALQEGFNTLCAREGTAVRTMAFLLRGDAKNFYESRSQSATHIKGSSTTSELTGPRMFHDFIARYLTDNHLRTAYESMTRILQQPEEPEDGFAQRIERNAANFCRVFKKHEVVSNFIQGLPPRIRYTVAEQVKNFVEQERGSMLTARSVVAAEGRSVRARFGDPGGRMRLIRSRDTMNAGGTRRSSQNLVPTMYTGSGMDLCGSHRVPSSTTERKDRVADVWETVMLAKPLKKCCGRQDAHTHAPVTGINPPSSASGGSTSQTIDVTGRNGQPRLPPALTEEQMRRSWLVMPFDEAMYSCWSCRIGEHSLFTFPYIPAHARAFFAYRNYLYQTGESAQMAEYFREYEGRHPQADTTQAPPLTEVPTELPAPTPRSTVDGISKTETHRGTTSLSASSPVRVFTPCRNTPRVFRQRTTSRARASRVVWKGYRYKTTLVAGRPRRQVLLRPTLERLKTDVSRWTPDPSVFHQSP